MRGSGPPGTVRNPDRSTVLGDRIRLATGFFDRFLGLQLATPLRRGEGLWLVPCGSIHTCFMRFPIDLAFTGRGSVVVAIHAGVRPWRIVPPVSGAYGCLELPTGTLASSQTEVGDQLLWETGHHPSET